jgi:hypothetical protein
LSRRSNFAITRLDVIRKVGGSGIVAETCNGVFWVIGMSEMNLESGKDNDNENDALLAFIHISNHSVMPDLNLRWQEMSVYSRLLPGSLNG